MHVSPAVLALTNADLTTFWLQLAVLLGAALVLGAAARRLGQPAVLGELLAGILLGPTALGAAAPGVQAQLFPQDGDVQLLIAAIALVGVLFLVLGAGIDTDVSVVLRHRRASVGLVAGTLVLPAAVGAAVASRLPAGLLVDGVARTPVLLFFGAAFAVSALPVAARILDDLGLLQRPFAQITMAVAMVDTLVAWIVMGVAVGMLTHGTVNMVDLAVTLVGVGVFVVAALGAGQRTAGAALRRLNPKGEIVPALGAMLVLALAAAAGMGALRVEPALGAFLAGILLRRSGALPAAAPEALANVVRSFLAPVFFASAGLQVDLGALVDAEIALWTAVLLVAGSFAKFAGAVLGARFSGMDARSSWAIGAGLNARGALGIIVASVGVRAGLLSADGFTVVVLFAVVTTLAAPPLLRLFTSSDFQRVAGE